MTALQQIIKEAQAIRRKSPKMEWKKAVAQASAIYSSKNKGKKKVVKKAIKKKAIRKTATKKAVGKYVKTVRKGKITDVIYKRKKIGAVKKSATTMHKDTKSHNVNIRVMSGINDKILTDLKAINQREEYFLNNLNRLKFDYLALKTQKNSKGQMIANKRLQAQLINVLKTIKKEKTNLKKHIK